MLLRGCCLCGVLKGRFQLVLCCKSEGLAQHYLLGAHAAPPRGLDELIQQARTPTYNYDLNCTPRPSKLL